MQNLIMIPYNPYRDLHVPAGRDAFAILFNTELDFMAEIYSKNEAYKRLRRSAVEFIENQSRRPNFDALIPYMAMTYFDRFILNRKIPDVVEPHEANMNLFLTCCLTIAWKLRAKTFVLSRFLNERNLQYSAENVQAMELHICRHLDWRMRTLTPFCFVQFFIPFRRCPHYFLRSLRQLIVKSQFDIAFTEYRPSVLAASAMLTVTSKMFPAEKHIITSESTKPLMDMVYKCSKMLAPLYRNPSTAAEPRAAPGEASTSVGRKQNDPIPILVPGGQTSTATETQICTPEMSDEELIFSFSPGTSAPEELADPEQEESHDVFHADPEELMNLELGWIEDAQADTDRRGVAQADTDRRGGPQAESRVGCGTYLVQRLTGGCCSNSMQRCSIL